jgi:para-nitrobenzyl esterase
VLRERNGPPGGAPPDFRRLANRLGFSPVMDGKIMPAQPFEPRASSLSAGVPMIIGSNLNEFVTALNHPEYEQMTLDDLQQHVTSLFGDRMPSIIDAFRGRIPNATPFDLWSRIAASTVRAAAIQQARAKSAVGAAPAYMYWFTWQTPVLDGRPRAFHCAELPFVFDNTDRCETMTGGGAEARTLAAKMSEAWLAFARTGNPNHPAIPHWPACSGSSVPTMMFDNNVLVANDPDGGEQRSIG